MTPFSSNQRNALTLVELLVVVTIMVLLLGVVLPLAGPAMRGREIREAARQVSTFLLAAQADAIASGRPVGVVLKPDTNDFTRCYVLEKTRIPAPFSARNILAKFVPNTPPDADYRYLQFSSATFPPSRIIRPNSTFQIQFDYRGKIYTGTRVTNRVRFSRKQFSDLNGDGILGDDDDLPPPTRPTSNGASFSIFLPPKRTSASRLELPTGAYIDLITSGVATHYNDANSVENNPNRMPADYEGVFYHDMGYLPDVGSMPPRPLEPVHILFDGQGHLDKLWGEIVFPGIPSDANENRVSGPWQPLSAVHLMITNVKRVMPQPPIDPPPAQRAQLYRELSKALVATNGGMWVSITPAGKVATTGNVGIPVDPANPAMFKAALFSARSNIRSSPQAGGR